MAVAERRFSAMGTKCHVLLYGADAEPLALEAQRRVGELESRWSRFQPDSEISSLNACAGQVMEVSADTLSLVAHAIAAWRRTAGRFDPTMGRQIAELGYNRSFETISALERSGVARVRAAVGCADIELDSNARTVRLPRSVQFDPGGIGKGLAADIVSSEAMATGASGVLVNLGGDLRVQGSPPEDDAWTITIREPSITEDALATIRLPHGAVATSTTLKRTWQLGNSTVHHALDPSTGSPHHKGITLASVVTGAGWWAEAAASALLGSTDIHRIQLDVPALIHHADGSVERLDNYEGFER